jgi:hypothetical protein
MVDKLVDFDPGIERSEFRAGRIADTCLAAFSAEEGR